MSEYGELATTPFINGSTACNTTIDAHVNFSPVGARFHFDFIYIYPENPPENIPYYNSYAIEELFGVIGAEMVVVQYNTAGIDRFIQTLYWRQQQTKTF